MAETRELSPPPPSAEQAPAARYDVVLTAARPWTEDGTLRAQLVATGLLGMLSVHGTAGLELVVGSDAKGDADLRFVVHGTDAEELALSVAEELERLVTVRIEERAAALPAPQWQVDQGSRAEVGFSVGTNGSAHRAVDAEQATLLANGLVRWLSLSLQHPGTTLRLAVTEAVGRSSVDVVTLRAGIDAPDADLPLSLRAHLRTMAPEWRLSDGPSDCHVQIDRAELSRVIAAILNHGGDLPGLASAPTPPVPRRPTYSQSPAEEGMRVGAAVTPAGRRVDVVLEQSTLTRHCQVVGMTGAGKSSFLVAQQLAWARQGRGFLLLDPHGTTCRSVIAGLSDEQLDRVVYVEAGDHENPVKLNPLHIDDPVQLDIVVQDLVLVFYQLFDPGSTGIVGPMFEEWLTQGLKGLRAVYGKQTSILDIPRVYRDSDLEKRVARSVTDPDLIDFWRGTMARMDQSRRGELAGWVTSKFSRFKNTAALRAILASGHDALDPHTVMAENRIVLVDLSTARLGQVASDLLGFLYLTRFASAMPSRQGDEPFGYFLDEAQRFGVGSLPSLLSEGRKFGSSVTLAHQYLGQLNGQLAEAVDGNVGTTVAFRTGVRDALTLVERMGGEISARQFGALGDLHAIIHRSASAVETHPHSLLIDVYERENLRTGADLDRAIARVRAATRREFVDPYREGRPEPARPARELSPGLKREQYLRLFAQHGRDDGADDTPAVSRDSEPAARDVGDATVAASANRGTHDA